MKARRSKEKKPKLDSKAQTKKQGQHIDMNYDKEMKLLRCLLSRENLNSEFSA